MSGLRLWVRRTVCKLPVGVWLLAGAGLLATVMAVALGRSAFRAHREADPVQGPSALNKVAAVDPSPAEDNDEQALIAELAPSAGDATPPEPDKGILRTEKSNEPLRPRELKAKHDPAAKSMEKRGRTLAS